LQEAKTVECGPEKAAQRNHEKVAGRPHFHHSTEETKMHALVKRAALGFAALMLTGTGAAVASPTTPSVNRSTYFSELASTLLREVRTEAAAMNLHAETLGTFARKPQVHWQSHAFHLNRVKGHINKMNERLAELQHISNFVEPWQQRAIDQVSSHAAQVASSTQAAIVHLRGNQGRLFVPDYRDHLTTLAERSEDMSETLNKYLDYERAQNEFQRLQSELELERN
jgi:signal transduction histidine kinase